MALSTVTQDWLDAIRSAGAEPTVTVAIELSASDTRHFTSSVEASKLMGAVYSPSLTEITPITTNYNPITREVAKINEELNLKFLDDGVIRDLVTNERVKGKKVTIKVGEASLASTAYIDYWAGLVEDVEPDMGFLTLVCKNAYNKLAAKKYTRKIGWRNEHPFDVMNKLFLEAGLDSTFVNSATFNPFVYSATISHFTVCRDRHRSNRDDRRVLKEESVLENIKELSEITQATVIPRENGKLDLVTYDSTTAAVATLTYDDILDFKQGTTFDTVVNIVQLGHAWTGESVTMGENATSGGARDVADNSFYREIILKDDESLSTHSYVDSPNDIEYLHRANTRWVGGQTRRQGAIAQDYPAGATSFSVVGGDLMNFAGAWRRDTDSKYDGMKITADRLMYLQNGSEIMSISSIAWSSAAGSWRHGANQLREGTDPDNPPDPGDVDLPDLPTEQPKGDAIFYVKSRSEFGTPERSINSSARFYDVTPLVHWGKNILGRFADGAPAVTIRTGLEHHAIQPGDLVQLGTAADPVDLYLEFGSDGAGTNEIKLECIGKETDPIGDRAGCIFTFVRARSEVHSTTTGEALTLERTTAIDRIMKMTEGTTEGNYIESGYKLGTSSGLFVFLTPGTARIAGLHAGHPQSTTLQLEASKDNYVAFDPDVPGFMVSAQTIGAAQSETPLNFVPVIRITTDGSSVTSTADLRVLRGFNAAKLTAKTVGASALSRFGVATGGHILNHQFEDFQDFEDDKTIGPPDFFDVFTTLTSSAQWGTDIDVADPSFGGNSGTNVIRLRKSTMPRYLTSDRFVIDPGQPYRIDAGLGTDTTSASVVFGLQLFSTMTSSTVLSTPIAFNGGSGVTFPSGSWRAVIGTVLPRLSDTGARYAKLIVGDTGASNTSSFIDYVSVIRQAPSLVACKPSAAAKQTITSGATATLIFGDTIIDNFGAFSNSATYTIPVTGLYEISGSGGLSTASSDFSIEIFVNGTREVVLLTAFEEGLTTHSASRIMELNQGDTVELRGVAVAGDVSYVANAAGSNNCIQVRLIE